MTPAKISQSLENNFAFWFILATGHIHLNLNSHQSVAEKFHNPPKLLAVKKKKKKKTHFTLCWWGKKNDTFGLHKVYNTY